MSIVDRKSENRANYHDRIRQHIGPKKFISAYKKVNDAENIWPVLSKLHIEVYNLGNIGQIVAVIVESSQKYH